MWEMAQRGNNATCSALSWLSVTSPGIHKQIGPFWCWFPGGWACIGSRTVWVSPVSSLVRLGVSPATATPTGLYSQRFWGFLFPMLEPGVVWSVSLPSCSSRFIRMQMWDCPVLQLPPCCVSSLPQLPDSAPPTILNECFFFSSLVVGLLYSSIFLAVLVTFCF